MIVVHVIVKVKPEQQAEFINQEKQFMTAAQQMKGCTSFFLYQDVHQENTFVIYETWETQADFENYSQSELLTQYRQTIGPMLMGAPETNYYNATHLEK